MMFRNPKILLPLLMALTLSDISAAVPQKKNKPKEQNQVVISDPSQPILMSSQEPEWTVAPSVLPEGAMMSIIDGDPSQPAPFTIRLKLPANYQIQAHWLPVDEHLTVVSGALNIGMGDKLDYKKGKTLDMGSFARLPARMNHYAWTTEETIIQLQGLGPWGINYVEGDKSKVPANDEEFLPGVK
jgi:hypothetical protein